MSFRAMSFRAKPVSFRAKRGIWRTVIIAAWALGSLTVVPTNSHAQAWTATDPKPIAKAVEAVGFTVSDMDRAIEFYSRVLTFEKISDVELTGDAYERLEGVF